jgi:murein DD-endopeptidase MepM/ murein hydrolase activator NlpD
MDEKIKLHRPVAAEFKISSPYGPRIHPVTGETGKMHYGVDFATPSGTPIVAALSGIIARIGWEDENDHGKGFGLRVWQRCGDIFICYAHLSQVEVYAGYNVTAGERIGLTGNTGASSGSHCHVEVRKGGIAGFKGVEFEFIEDIERPLDAA